MTVTGPGEVIVSMTCGGGLWFPGYWSSKVRVTVIVGVVKLVTSTVHDRMGNVISGLSVRRTTGEVNRFSFVLTVSVDVRLGYSVSVCGDYNFYGFI